MLIAELDTACIVIVCNLSFVSKLWYTHFGSMTKACANATNGTLVSSALTTSSGAESPPTPKASIVVTISSVISLEELSLHVQVVYRLY